jgi:hypothetical protein
MYGLSTGEMQLVQLYAGRESDLLHRSSVWAKVQTCMYVDVYGWIHVPSVSLPCSNEEYVCID